MTPAPIAQKPITIHDVAGALGMHKSTVSLAFSGKGNLSAATRERVLTAARELGYEPNPLAQRLAHGGSNNVVYIFSGVLDVGLATEKILIIQRELNRQALEVPIYTCGETGGHDMVAQAAQIKQLCRQRPRAIVCSTQMLSPSVFRELETYQRGGGIVISYDSPAPLECDQVVFDREDNGYQAARHLLERGHRRIGLSYPTRGNPDARIAASNGRLRGFRRALDEFGVALHAEWIFTNPTYEKGGAAMARQFLDLLERPTGLCIVNDYVALGFMVEVMRAGLRIPEEVSIVGHDDQPIASYCPVPLTSISQPVEDIARAVVELLLERLEGSAALPRTVTLKGQLMPRESVAARSSENGG